MFHCKFLPEFWILIREHNWLHNIMERNGTVPYFAKANTCALYAHLFAVNRSSFIYQQSRFTCVIIFYFANIFILHEDIVASPFLLNKWGHLKKGTV